MTIHPLLMGQFLRLQRDRMPTAASQFRISAGLIRGRAWQLLPPQQPLLAAAATNGAFFCRPQTSCILIWEPIKAISGPAFSTELTHLPVPFPIVLTGQ